MVSYIMAFMLLLMKDKRDMRPLFLKLGVALALSFAGFFYTQLRTRRIRPSLKMPPPPSGNGFKFDLHGRVGLKDDLCSIHTPLSSCDDSPFSSHEPSSFQKVTSDGNVVGLSPTSKHSGEEDGLLVPGFKELVQEDIELGSNKADIFPRKEVDTAMASKGAANKEETEQEIRKLRNTVKFLQEREKNFETQLLEYYGLKEQEAVVKELQNRLKINNLEAKFFTLKIESLQAENQSLKAQVADYAQVVADLESARAKIKMLKRKRSDEERNKKMLSVLQQSVANLQEQEQMALINDSDVQNNLQKLKELAEELAELKRANSDLQQENSELARRLDSTQILASSIFEDSQTEELRVANNNLILEKEELGKELESLRADRCADVEELVYLRWINACLRYEMRNHQPQPGKTMAKDLSKNLSPKSEEKAKQLILEYANSEGLGDKGSSIVDFDIDYWSSSQTSYVDSGEYDDTSADIVSSTTRSHSSSKSKFFKKLKNFVTGKDSHHQRDHRTSSLDRNQTRSSGGSGRIESASSTSFEDSGPNSYDTLSSSHHNSCVMETPLTGIGARSHGRSTHIAMSKSLSRHSLDIQRIRNLGLDDTRDEERIQRSITDFGSSSFGYKRMDLGESGIIGLPENLQLDQDEPDAREKLELLKFAEILKGTHGTSGSMKSVA